jgi:hypothetical protein
LKGRNRGLKEGSKWLGARSPEPHLRNWLVLSWVLRGIHLSCYNPISKAMKDTLFPLRKGF